MKSTPFVILLTAIAGLASAQITWNMGMNVAPASSGNNHPRIVTDASGNPLIVWNHSMQAMFSRWSGTAFTTPVMVNPGSQMVAGADWMGPDIAAKGDTVYIVYKLMPEADTASHIFIVRSFDGGMNWSMPYQVDQIADSISRFPTVAIDDNGHPIVAFMKFDASFSDSRWVVSRSNDYGNTFGPDTKASGWSGGLICDCCPGALVHSGNRVLMVYRDNLSNLRDHWAGISLDNGNSFTSGMPIDQSNWMIASCPGSGPDAVIAGDSLYTAYMSSAPGSARAYFSAASVSDMTGTIGAQITGPLAGLTTQNYPRIATDGTAMVIGWRHVLSGVDQFGLIFTNDISVGFPAGFDTVDLSNVINVDVALADGTVYTVWEDDNSGTVKFRSGTYNSTVAVSESDRQGIRIFPNPLTSEFIIESSASSSMDYTVSDGLGRTVKGGKTDPSGRTTVHAGQLSAGIYLLTLRSAFQFSTHKLIIQN